MSTDRPFRDPKYRKKKVHVKTYAVVTLPDGLGGRRDFLLGAYGTKASRMEYRRRLAEWEAAGRTLPPDAADAELSVNELALRFMVWAKNHYRRPDGSPSRELEDYQLSIRLLRKLYGGTSAKDFGPLALKALRAEMIHTPVTRTVKARDPQTGQVRIDPETCKPVYIEKVVCAGLCRGLVNQRVGRIKRIFKWGVSEQLIPESVHRALLTVEGLLRGRSKARETEPVKPVPVAFVEATLPHLLPTVQAMAELQLATGMRPGEVCAMRSLDVETSGAVWFYRPGSDQGPEGVHKTSWRGHRRVVAIGPRGQQILQPWLRPNLTEAIFQPQEAMAAFRARQRQKRQTRVQPSQTDRRKARPKKRPGVQYTVRAYAQAVRKACEKANVPHWHPHQLRHTAATLIRKEFGLDAARAVLGHRSPAITETYAEIDQGKASEVALKLG